MKEGRPDQTYPGSVRIRRAADFRDIMASGSRGVARHVVAFLASEGADPRIGIVASRKVGKAFRRNRVRRRLREMWRRSAARPRGDLVLLARPGSAEASWTDLERSCHAALRRASRRRQRTP